MQTVPVTIGQMIARLALGNDQVRVDTSQLRYVVIQNDGTQAEVIVTGELTVALAATPFSERVTFAMPMRHQSGSWTYCPRS